MYKYGDKEISSEDALLILNHRLTDKDLNHLADDIKIAILKAKEELSYRCYKKLEEQNHRYENGELCFDRFCPTCGEPYNHSNDEYVRFCPNCGQKLDY